MKLIEVEALRISKADKVQHEKAEMIAGSIRVAMYMSVVTMVRHLTF